MDAVFVGVVLTAALTAGWFYVLYAVVRHAVRDGIQDARTARATTGPHEAMHR